MRTKWLVLLMVLPLLFSTVSAQANPPKKARSPWQISMRCGASLFVAASLAIATYSVGYRYLNMAPERDKKSYELQSVPFTTFSGREELKQTLVQAAFHERRYFQSWHPEYLRQTLQFYAEAHPSIATFAKAKGIPLHEDAAFRTFLGITGTELDMKEVRPLVDPPFPGVISHRDAVDALIAEVYLLQFDWAESVGKIDFIHHSGNPGDVGKPFTVAHSFKIDWYATQNNAFFSKFRLDATGPGIDPGMDYASDIALYLRSEWRRKQRDTGAIIRQLFETYPEAVQRAYDCEGPGILPDLLKLADGERFNQLAGGFPYGFNRENLELVDKALAEMVRDFATAVKSKQRQLTARQLIEEFLKANRLE